MNLDEIPLDKPSLLAAFNETFELKEQFLHNSNNKLNEFTDKIIK